jgi:hypothetical protein
VEHYNGALQVKATPVLTSCRARFPMFYMEALKEQHTRRLLEKLMIDSGTTACHRVLQSTDKKQTQDNGMSPSGVCHHHRMNDRLCLSCTTQEAHSQGIEQGIQQWDKRLRQ